MREQTERTLADPRAHSERNGLFFRSLRSLWRRALFSLTALAVAEGSFFAHCARCGGGLFFLRSLRSLWRRALFFALTSLAVAEGSFFAHFARCGGGLSSPGPAVGAKGMVGLPGLEPGTVRL